MYDQKTLIAVIKQEQARHILREFNRIFPAVEEVRLQLVEEQRQRRLVRVQMGYDTLTSYWRIG